MARQVDGRGLCSMGEWPDATVPRRFAVGAAKGPGRYWALTNWPIATTAMKPSPSIPAAAMAMTA